MVPLQQPDLARHPRFREALAAARTAELGPGDAIYIPALWWHNVEALDAFNMLVNYWWRPGPAEAGSGFEALIHSIHSVSALPAAQRAAWRHMFDHYVFRPGDEDPAEHIAPQHRGVLGKPTPQLRGKIRQFLQTMLSRP
jgi:hypothetical protein